jgi:enamine deaminase RidA (YjgF/YER057c/UK114 family)
MSPFEALRPQTGPPAQGHFTPVIRVPAGQDMVFISGLTARDESGAIVGVGDPAEQTRQVCRNLVAYLAAANATLDDVVSLTVYLTDISHRDATSQARKEYFTGTPPTSTLVEVSALVHPDMLIEISAIAVQGQRSSL